MYNTTKRKLYATAQTANVLKSNFTRPIGSRVLAVKCKKNGHYNLEERTRQLTTMMDLMPPDLTAVNSTLPASLFSSFPEPEELVWFENRCLALNKLGSMMKELSKAANLT